MTVATTISAMQTINAAITGITTAPTVYPGSLSTADMPIAIVWPADAESSQNAGFKMAQRVYRVAVYIMPVDQGRGIDEGWQDTITIIQRFVDAYLSPANVILVSDATYQASVRSDNERPLIDGGIEVIAYPPPATGNASFPHYFGFVLNVPVKETWA